MSPRILYAYLIREFLKIFAIAVGGFLIVCLVGDAAERLSSFIDAQAPARLILLFYLYQIPYYLIFVLPASSLIATLFTLGQMNRHNELVAMLASGISLGRIFMPLLGVMLIISGLSFVVDEKLTPVANARKKEIYDYQIRGRVPPEKTIRKGVDYQAENGRRWIAEIFNLNTATMKDVKLLKFAGSPESPRIDYRIDASAAVFKPDSGWIFTGGTLRSFNPQSRGEWAISFERLLLPRFSERPADFMIEFKEAQQMNIAQLKKAIQRKRRNGIKVERDETELWLKTSLPAANFIIVIFGAPLAVLRRRIGPGVGIALGVVVYMLYMASFYLTRSMGYSGIIHPAAAAWSPNAIFAVAGFLIFLKVRK